jgi:hypothetical protein
MGFVFYPRNKRTGPPANAGTSNVKVGERFGRLVVTEILPASKDAAGYPLLRARVLCDCGTSKDVRRRDLRNGKTRSCGCLGREKLALGRMAMMDKRANDKAKREAQNAAKRAYRARIKREHGEWAKTLVLVEPQVHQPEKYERRPIEERSCYSCGWQAHVISRDNLPRCRPCNTKYERRSDPNGEQLSADDFFGMEMLEAGHRSRIVAALLPKLVSEVA